MTKSQIARLGTFELFHDTEVLRGTPFWTKRETITARQLQNKPAYRTLTLMTKLAKENNIPAVEFNMYYHWVQSNFTAEDETAQSVRNFRRTYGKFDQQRLLLTSKNAIDLFLKTRGKDIPD